MYKRIVFYLFIFFFFYFFYFFFFLVIYCEFHDFLYVFQNILVCIILGVWINFSADNKLKYFFSFPRKPMHIVSNGDNLHKISNPVFWEI